MSTPAAGQRFTVAQALAVARDSLSAEAVLLLRAVRGAQPSLRALALGTAPAELRAQLIGAGLAEDRSAAGRGGCELTAAGLALTEILESLTAEERADLAHRVDLALAGGTA